MTDLTPSTALDVVDRPSEIAQRSNLPAGPGGVSIESLPEAVEFAKIMCQAQQAIPKPFRGQPGMCLAVTMQALRWGFDPFGVAQNAYVVNDKVAYEAKLIKAAIDQNAPLDEPLDYVFEGEGQTRTCKVIGKIRTDRGAVVERTYQTVPLKDIKTQNSPLWKSDPDQQLMYFATRAWARRHTPGVLLGVFSKDDILDEGSVINARAEATQATRAAFPATERMRQQRIAARTVAPAPEPQNDVPARDVSEDIDDEIPAHDDAPAETGEDAVRPASDPQEGAVENPASAGAAPADPAPSDETPQQDESARRWYAEAMAELKKAKPEDRAAVLRKLQDEPSWFHMTDTQAKTLEKAAQP